MWVLGWWLGLVTLEVCSNRDYSVILSIIWSAHEPACRKTTVVSRAQCSLQFLHDNFTPKCGGCHLRSIAAPLTVAFPSEGGIWDGWD